MNDCVKIEKLLYLHREGELSPEEMDVVREHVTSCATCREVLGNLTAIDNALVSLRESVPDLAGDSKVADNVLSRIDGRPSRIKALTGRRSGLDDLLAWMRPALGVAMLAAIALYLAQESRDAVKINDLEERLRLHGNKVAIGKSSMASEARRLMDATSGDREGEASLSSSKRALNAADPMQALGSGLLSFLKQNNGLFEELAGRYPKLAAITLSDGIDEQEQKVLATEGKDLMTELQKLLKEGERSI